MADERLILRLLFCLMLGAAIAGAGRVCSRGYSHPYSGAAGWPQEMSKLSVRRLPPTPTNPRDGDVSAVFAFYEQSFEDAHVYFYHNGGWRFLFNTSDVGFWLKNARKAVQERLASLR